MDRRLLASIRPFANSFIRFVYRNPCKGDWRSHSLGGRAVPRCPGLRPRPRPRARNCSRLTPEAAGNAVAFLMTERILLESQVHRLLALEPRLRNRVLLRLLYAGGGRVSENCNLKWRDVQPRDAVGQITSFGKGGKTRTELLSADTWAELITLQGSAGPDAPVFASRKGQGHLHPSQAGRIVQAAANRAGVEGAVSPHWLRHARASHVLDRGAPIRLVQATLGHAPIATTGKYLHAWPEDRSAGYLGV
jgi:integrase/recombinase XerD